MHACMYYIAYTRVRGVWRAFAWYTTCHAWYHYRITLIGFSMPAARGGGRARERKRKKMNTLVKMERLFFSCWERKRLEEEQGNLDTHYLSSRRAHTLIYFRMLDQDLVVLGIATDTINILTYLTFRRSQYIYSFCSKVLVVVLVQTTTNILEQRE